MKQEMKRILILLLCAMLMISMMPTSVFAEEVLGEIETEQIEETEETPVVEEEPATEETAAEKAEEDIIEPAEATVEAPAEGIIEEAAEETIETIEEIVEEVSGEDVISEEPSEADASIGEVIEETEETVKEDLEELKEETEESEEDAEEAEESEEAPVAFDESKTIDGIKITVKAEEGAFPAGSTLSVRKVTAAEEKKAEAAVESERDENANVATSYTFDIKVLDKDGNEIQPAEGKKVEVLFKAEEIANENLETSVYHIKEEGSLVAESLDTTEKGDTVAAETDGFSYYTVEFTYGELQYVMKGDTEIPLNTILDEIGLTGTVTKAVSSSPELFSVEQRKGQWIVTALQAFCSEETLSLTIDGIDYVIKVTDDVTDDPHNHNHTGWTAWNNTTSLPNTTGKYYLNTNVTLSNDVFFNNNVELCLNGHTITMNGSDKVINTGSGKKLTIYDEPGNSGGIVFNNNRLAISDNSVFNLYGGTFKGCTRWTEGALTINGSGIFNMYGGVFSGNKCGSALRCTGGTARMNIYGGEFTGNELKNAPIDVQYGAVYIYDVTISGNSGRYGGLVAGGNVYMSGGTITGNTGKDAAVYAGNKTLNLSGAVYISGNKLNTGEECNVKLDSNNYRINISGELTNTTPIGITVYTPPTGNNTVEFTTGLNGKGTAANFSSDNPNCAVTIKNNEAHLVNHSHTFNYTADGDTITAECVNTTTPCSLPDNKTTLKIVKPALAKYGGSESAEATFEGTVPGVTPAAEYYKGTEKLDAAPTNAGTYKAQVTLKGSDEIEATAFVEYTIEKEDISPVVNIEGWDYGDTPNDPSVTGNTGNGAVTYTYYTDEACTQKTGADHGAASDGAVPSMSGDYWVKASIAETTNYNSGNAKKAFKINATAITATGLKFNPRVYDGTTEAILDITEASLVGVKSGDDVRIESAIGTFVDKNAGEGKTINNITIVLSGTHAGGYTATADPTTLTGTILPKEVTVSGIIASGKTYDGNTTTTLTFTNATFDGIVTGDELSVKGKYTQEGTFDTKDAGEDKTVTLPELMLDGGDAGNYTIKSDSQTVVTARIEKKVINVAANDASKKYDEDDGTFTYDADDLIGEDTFTGKLERVSGEDVGDYDINQGTLDAGKNYSINFTKGIFTIEKAPTNSLVLSIEDWTYGDEPKEPTATADHGIDTVAFTYGDSYEGEFTPDVPTEAGTWYVKATIEETDNYPGAEKKVAFTIEQKTVELEWADQELEYNGYPQAPTATVANLEDDDECDVSVTGEKVDANVKSGEEKYVAEAVKLSNQNYKLPDETTADFIITPKHLTPDMIGLDSELIEYDSTEKGPTVTMTDREIFDGSNGKEMVEGEDYTLEGEVKSSKTGTHFITIKGQGNYKGTLTTSWKMYKNKSHGYKEPGGKGDFEIFVDIEGNTENITVDNLTIEIARKLLTEEDIERYNAGENVLIYVELFEESKAAADATEEELLIKKFKEIGAEDIRWFDITVWKKIGNDAAVQLHEIGTALEMTIDVPAEYQNAEEGYTRTFYFGRAHDGEAEIIAETNEIKVKFSSDKFSTYALGFKDTENKKEEVEPGEGSGSESGEGGSGTDGETGPLTGTSNLISGDTNPKTGDENNIIIWIGVVLLAAAIALTVRRQFK